MSGGKDVLAEAMIRFASAEFGAGLTVTSSFQDTVLVDLAVRTAAAVEIVFLDTGFHFEETLALIDAAERRYGINVMRLRPSATAARPWDSGEQCCQERKVEPLRCHLAGRRAWVTGVRRREAPSRANAEAVSWDARFGVVKINPLVDWADEDVAAYERARGLLIHPLRSIGYGSIGCASCTAPGAGREGRWAGTGRLECGLHR